MEKKNVEKERGERWMTARGGLVIMEEMMKGWLKQKKTRGWGHSLLGGSLQNLLQ